MVPQRKEPLHNWMLIAWLSLPVGLAVGQLTVGPSLAWLGVRVFICYMAITGARKADVALDAGITFGLRHLSLWHAVWDFRGILTAKSKYCQFSLLISFENEIPNFCASFSLFFRLKEDVEQR